jgi:hypothetical protein
VIAALLALGHGGLERDALLIGSVAIGAIARIGIPFIDVAEHAGVRDLRWMPASASFSTAIICSSVNCVLS